MRLDFLPRLGDLDVPTLWLLGQKDEQVALEKCRLPLRHPEEGSGNSNMIREPVEAAKNGSHTWSAYQPGWRVTLAAGPQIAKY